MTGEEDNTNILDSNILDIEAVVNYPVYEFLIMI